MAIRRQTGLFQLPSNATLLHSSKGDSVIAILAAVDPHHSRLDGLCHAVRLGEIGSKNCASKTVRGVIGTLTISSSVLKEKMTIKGPKTCSRKTRISGLTLVKTGLDEEAFAAEA